MQKVIKIIAAVHTTDIKTNIYAFKAKSKKKQTLKKIILRCEFGATISVFRCILGDIRCSFGANSKKKVVKI